MDDDTLYYDEDQVLNEVPAKPIVGRGRYTPVQVTSHLGVHWIVYDQLWSEQLPTLFKNWRAAYRAAAAKNRQDEFDSM